MKLFIKLFALILCLSMVISLAVACGGNKNDDEIYEDYQSDDSENESDTGFVTAPVEETEDDAYINAAPANDEQGWGPLTPPSLSRHEQ